MPDGFTNRIKFTKYQFTLEWDDLHYGKKGQQLAFYNFSVHICVQGPEVS